MDTKNFLQFAKAARADIVAEQEGANGFFIYAYTSHVLEDGKVEKEMISLDVNTGELRKVFKSLKAVGDLLRKGGVKQFRVTLSDKEIDVNKRSKKKAKPAAKAAAKTATPA